MIHPSNKYVKASESPFAVPIFAITWELEREKIAISTKALDSRLFSTIIIDTDSDFMTDSVFEGTEVTNGKVVQKA